MNKTIPDTSNGITMEIPYKCFQTPAVFWNLIKRNILPAIPVNKTVFSQEGATTVLREVILVLNAHTDRTLFNAKGLLKDQVEPSDDVYQEWTKSLKFFLTVTNQSFGVLKFSLGMQEINPWTGIGVEEIGSFAAELYMTADGMYHFTPALAANPSEMAKKFVNGDCTISVSPFCHWTSGGDFSAGMIPSLVTSTDLWAQLELFINNNREKLLETFPSEVVLNDGLEVAKQQLTEQIQNFSNWSGGDLFLSSASFYSRIVPYRTNDDQAIGMKGYKLYIVMAARGNYEVNFYANPVLTVTD